MIVPDVHGTPGEFSGVLQLLRFLCRAALFLWLGHITALSSHATLDGDRELLKLAAEARKDNIERILTWCGEARIEDLRENEDGVVRQHIKCSASFAYDRKSNTTRWNWIVNEHFSLEDGQLKLSSNQKFYPPRSAMKKGDAFYRFGPGFVGADSYENTLVIWPKEEQKVKGLTYDFDPMWYFTQRGYDLDGRLMHQYREADNPKMTPASVIRQGDLVIWEKKRDTNLNHFELDLSKSGNLLVYIGKSKSPTGEVVERCDWEYENLNGIWAPKSFKYENSGVSKGKRYKSIQKVEFIGNRINQPVDPAEFSLEKLGVVKGTMITDRITGLAYRHGELPKWVGEFVKENTKLNNAVSSSSHTPIESSPSTPSFSAATPKPAPEENGGAEAALVATTDSNTSVWRYLPYVAALLFLGLIGFVVIKKQTSRGG